MNDADDLSPEIKMLRVGTTYICGNVAFFLCRKGMSY